MTCLSKFMFKNKTDVQNKYQHQIILIFDRLKIQTTKFEEEFSIYDRILKINKTDETCFKYRRIIIWSRTAFREIKLNEYYEKEKVLYHDEKLCILNDVDLLLKFIRESHDSLICDYFNVIKMIELLKRYYYWLNMIKIVK